jgi:hypothetical protein
MDTFLILLAAFWLGVVLGFAVAAVLSVGAYDKGHKDASHG